jgi:hypothetical protein
MKCRGRWLYRTLHDPTSLPRFGSNPVFSASQLADEVVMMVDGGEQGM